MSRQWTSYTRHRQSEALDVRAIDLNKVGLNGSDANNKVLCYTLILFVEPFFQRSGQDPCPDRAESIRKGRIFASFFE